MDTGNWEETWERTVGGHDDCALPWTTTWGLAQKGVLFGDVGRPFLQKCFVELVMVVAYGVILDLSQNAIVLEEVLSATKKATK
jgi:hypothetical protein